MAQQRGQGRSEGDGHSKRMEVCDKVRWLVSMGPLLLGGGGGGHWGIGMAQTHNGGPSHARVEGRSLQCKGGGGECEKVRELVTRYVVACPASYIARARHMLDTSYERAKPPPHTGLHYNHHTTVS